ncbi:MAG: hypothetical protein U0P82_07840 [Vicinamibacterales bacterium]
MMQERTTHGGNWRRLAAAIVAGAAVIAGATSAQAQSAVIYGSLGNFDIANDTGKVCHGFEIDLDGLTVDQMSGAFSSNRYGMPTITSTPTGVAVRYQTTYSPGAGWATRTLPHTVPWFSGQCYQWVAGTYENGGCEHFGTYTVANPTKVTARWMCESDADPSVLVPVDPPTAVPMPTYYVQPPAQPNNPPQLVAEVVAPEPAEVQGLFGNAQWLRSFRVELLRPIALDELMADDPAVVPMDPGQLESDFSILQDEPPSNSNGNRRQKRNSGSIAPTTRAVVRRIETWEFTGQYDPITHEALCADGTCSAPAPDEIGQLIAVQMSGANVQPDALTVSTSGNGSVDSSDKLIACGKKCVQPYNAGTVVTLTARASSGSYFAGWSGACAGTQSTCVVTVNGGVTAVATFAPQPTKSGGTGGGSAFTLQVSRSNSGTVTATPAGDKTINCGGTCTARFTPGTRVTLTATPAAGKAFLNWGGACTTAGANPTCTLTVNSDVTVQPNFSK